MGHFGMELDPVHVCSWMFHGNTFDIIGICGTMKSIGNRLNLISMTHPHDHFIFRYIFE